MDTKQLVEFLNKQDDQTMIRIEHIQKVFLDVKEKYVNTVYGFEYPSSLKNLKRINSLGPNFTDGPIYSHPFGMNGEKDKTLYKEKWGIHYIELNDEVVNNFENKLMSQKEKIKKELDKTNQYFDMVNLIFLTDKDSFGNISYFLTTIHKDKLSEETYNRLRDLQRIKKDKKRNSENIDKELSSFIDAGKKEVQKWYIKHAHIYSLDYEAPPYLFQSISRIKEYMDFRKNIENELELLPEIATEMKEALKENNNNYLKTINRCLKQAADYLKMNTNLNKDEINQVVDYFSDHIFKVSKKDDRITKENELSQMINDEEIEILDYKEKNMNKI